MRQAEPTGRPSDGPAPRGTAGATGWSHARGPERDQGTAATAGAPMRERLREARVTDRATARRGVARHGGDLSATPVMTAAGAPAAVVRDSSTSGRHGDWPCPRRGRRGGPGRQVLRGGPRSVPPARGGGDAVRGGRSHGGVAAQGAAAARPLRRPRGMRVAPRSRWSPWRARPRSWPGWRGTSHIWACGRLAAAADADLAAGSVLSPATGARGDGAVAVVAGPRGDAGAHCWLAPRGGPRGRRRGTVRARPRWPGPSSGHRTP